MRTKVQALVIGLVPIHWAAIFIRVMYGARISLTIGFVAAFINLVIGVTYGGIAGYLGGKVDRIMMGLVDVFVRYSTLPYVILLMVVLALA